MGKSHQVRTFCDPGDQKGAGLCSRGQRFLDLAMKSWTLENPSHPQNRSSGYLDTFTILKMEVGELEGISDNKMSTGQAWGPELNP